MESNYTIRGHNLWPIPEHRKWPEITELTVFLRVSNLENIILNITRWAIRFYESLRKILGIQENDPQLITIYVTFVPLKMGTHTQQLSPTSS